MSLHPVEGHSVERARLAAAIHARQLPNSLLLHGPAGIGKQRVGLWLAQTLLCEKPQQSGPCDACHSCRLAVRLEHPDLHWYFPLLRPKGVSADRLGDALEEARGAELVTRRKDPLRPTVPQSLAGFFIAHIHVLVRAAGSRPAMGSRKVFLIGDAEALVPQEASPEAANALLKLLEEPPSDTTVILTAGDPDVLLPTIRSRMLPIRLRPLPERDVASFLGTHGRAEPAEAERVSRLGQGSIGRALGFLKNGELEETRAAARSLLEAALEPKVTPRLAASLTQAPMGARGEFSDTLESLTLWLRDLAAASAGADEVIVNRDATDWLRAQAKRHPGAARGVPAALRDVEATLQTAQLNINPQLALAGLLRLLNRRLV